MVAMSRGVFLDVIHAALSGPQNKEMKLTKLSAAPLLGRRCRLMPALAGLDAGTASQLIRGARRTSGMMGADAVMGRGVRTLVLGPVGAIAVCTMVLASEQAPQQRQGALDLSKAVTIKSDHVAVNSDELRAAGVDPGAFTPPKRIKGSSPSYPDAAARDNAQGTVLLECLIAVSGTVEACRVTRSVHPAADRAAVNAIQRWKYEPAQVMAESRSIVAQFMMIFRLE